MSSSYLSDTAVMVHNLWAARLEDATKTHLLFKNIQTIAMAMPSEKKLKREVAEE